MGHLILSYSDSAAGTTGARNKDEAAIDRIEIRVSTLLCFYNLLFLEGYSPPASLEQLGKYSP